MDIVILPYQDPLQIPPHIYLVYRIRQGTICLQALNGQTVLSMLIKVRHQGDYSTSSNHKQLKYVINCILKETIHGTNKAIISQT